LGKKKKKPKAPKATTTTSDSTENKTTEISTDEKPTPLETKEDDTPDYTYEELLQRFYTNLGVVEKKKLSVKLPQMLSDGPRKSILVNFKEICDGLKRPYDHVISFIATELGTEAFMDGRQRLVMRGRWRPANMENVLRRYVQTYVICTVCKSPDTVLEKENRLFFVKCSNCKSRPSVAAVKEGYVATTNINKQRQH